MLQKQKCIEHGKGFGALLIHHSKVFDDLDDELLTAKLNASGFNLPGLLVVHDYLSNRKQRMKIENNLNTLMNILFGIP